MNRICGYTVAWVGAGLVLVLAGGCLQQQPEAAQKTESPTAAAAPATIQTKAGIEMVLVPAGEFLMGDERGEDDEKPAHRVRVSAFYMDTCEVTQAAFQAMLGRNSAKWQQPERPVERVSWFTAIQFCNMRSTREGLKPCYDLKTLQCDFTADGYRLPTEAEWEYACRAGTTSRWSFGDDSGELGKYGWFKANAGKTTHPVRQKPANPWGLVRHARERGRVDAHDLPTLSLRRRRRPGRGRARGSQGGARRLLAR